MVLIKRNSKQKKSDCKILLNKYFNLLPKLSILWFVSMTRLISYKKMLIMNVRKHFWDHNIIHAQNIPGNSPMSDLNYHENSINRWMNTTTKLAIIHVWLNRFAIVNCYICNMGRWRCESFGNKQRKGRLSV